MIARTPPSTKAEYRYNGLGQRVAYKLNGTGTWYDLVQDEQWREVAVVDRTNNKLLDRTLFHNAGLNGRGGSSYIDSAAIRETTPSTPTGGNPPVMQTRWYTLQNWRADVVATLASNGTLSAWSSYSAYGKQQMWRVADVDDGTGNGVPDEGVTVDDLNLFYAWFEAGDPRADIDDGSGKGLPDAGVTVDDLLFYMAYFEGSGGDFDSRIGYAGYVKDEADSGQSGLYHVRYRVYSVDQGHWLQVDPIDYYDSVNLFEYATSCSHQMVDPTGLATSPGDSVIDYFKDLGRGAKRVAKGWWYGGRSLCGDARAHAPAADHADFDRMVFDFVYDTYNNPGAFAGALYSHISDTAGNVPRCVVDGAAKDLADQILEAGLSSVLSKGVISTIKGTLLLRPQRPGRWFTGRGESVGIGIACLLYSQYGSFESGQQKWEQLRQDDPTAAQALENSGLVGLIGVTPDAHQMIQSGLSIGTDALMSKYCTPSEIDAWKAMNKKQCSK